MDPDVTLATLRDASADPAERVDAGRILLGWLRNGGYIPQGLFPPGRSYSGSTAAQHAADAIVCAELFAIEQAQR